MRCLRIFMLDDVNSWIETLLRGDLPSERSIRRICESATSILSEEPNTVILKSPISMCGDIHGQFSDLLELFQVGGRVGEYQYLFLGDYIDRGAFGLESFLLLILFKLRYPDRIWLIRGNHESRQVTMVYGFFDECLRKFGSPNVWKLCAEVFDMMPLAAIVDGRIFCVHGGLSPSVTHLDEVLSIDRKREIPNIGVLCDMLWGDPQDSPGWSVSSRGAGYLFGPDIVSQFNHTNDLDFICRSHQFVMEGYRWYFDKNLITVWSAPNYCNRCGNAAAVLQIDGIGVASVAVFEQIVHLKSTRYNTGHTYFR